MRFLLATGIALLLLPAALATQVEQGTIAHNTSVIAGGPPIPSNPLAQNADTYNVTLAPGMRIVADLAYADTSGNPVGNDLDLALGPPSQPPTPLLPPTDPAGALAWAQLTAAATVARAQCQNVVAQSHAHGLQPGGEHVDYTVPAGGERGVYRLQVTGFLLFQDQPYTLGVTVLDAAGNDVTASALGTQQLTPFVRTSAGCEFLFPPP
jgi:hypothetical protein